VAVLVAGEAQELFDGIILSSACLDVDSHSAGTLIVSEWVWHVYC